MNPKISIITVVLNNVATIERAIKSVIVQNYSNLEYLVIDGGSTDGTLDVINKYKSYIDFFVSEPDKGLYNALNKGIHNSSGVLIGIVHSDDWLEKNAVQTIANTYLKNDNYQIYHGKMCWHYKGHVKIKYPLKLTQFNFYWRRIPVLHPASFIHRSLYSKYKYDEDYLVVSDLELFWRAFNDGAKYYYLPELLTNHQGGGLSSNEEILVRESKLLRKKFSKNKIKYVLYVLISNLYSLRRWIKKQRLKFF